ncbi:MAG: hypothetical protein OEL77_05350 [Nitrosopumilus sp.]|nr:hypothetical protein [Nitrosopumilus sp.]MDH3385419.1 hypothetical protein [Nitrosopumilus sp.]
MGIITLIVFFPFISDHYVFAIKNTDIDQSISNLESEYPGMSNIQFFQTDASPPYIKITNPNHCSSNFINGTVLVEGISSDSDKVKMVEAVVLPFPFEGEIYFEPTTPIEPEDWSKWSIPLTIPNDQPHRILVHAYDYSGNEEWDETLVNTKRAQMVAQAVENQSEIKIAFVEPTFTNAAYNLDSFYFFYSKYFFTPNEQKITTDLDLLTGDIPLEYETGYFQNLFNQVKQTLPNSFVTIIGDEEIHDGSIFGNDEANLYDVLIFLHNEYVTQQYYDNMKEFLINGGSVILLNGNVFYAEILFDSQLCTITLVKGHDWEFDGNSAKPSVSERYLDENSEWFGSNYIVNALEDDVIFENNPFNYSHFEENHLTNPQAEILLDYKVKFAQPLLKPPTNPFVIGGILKEEPQVQYSHENKTIATYELPSGNGKVIHMGLYSQNLDSNPAFLNYFEKIILPRALDKTHPIESDYDTPDVYWMFPGGKISDIKLNSESRTLSMKASFIPNDNEHGLKESNLTIVIPKRALDAHTENQMTDFIVLVNGINTPYEESFDDVERGLKIGITEDSFIEIIGTSAIPEFNISIIVLIISIFAVLLFSRNNLKNQRFFQVK